MGIVAYSPLGKGILTTKATAPGYLAPADHRLTAPRFANGALERNAAKANALAAQAAARGCTPAQLALAWLMAQRDVAVVPIPGSKTPARVEENMGAAAVAARLTPADVADIGALDLQAWRRPSTPPVRALRGAACGGGERR